MPIYVSTKLQGQNPLAIYCLLPFHKFCYDSAPCLDSRVATLLEGEYTVEMAIMQML